MEEVVIKGTGLLWLSLFFLLYLTEAYRVLS